MKYCLLGGKNLQLEWSHTKRPSLENVNCTEIAATMHKMIQSNEPSVKLMDHLGRSLFLYQGHGGFYQFQ